MLLEHERFSMFGHGCSNDHMLLEDKRHEGLGVDALVTVCSRNTNCHSISASPPSQENFGPDSSGFSSPGPAKKTHGQKKAVHGQKKDIPKSQH